MKKTLTLAGILFSTLLLTSTANAAIIATDLEIAGDRGNESVSFDFSGLTAHTEITVNFDLFIQDSWDGTGVNGIDEFGFAVDGVELFRGAFDNFNAADNPAGLSPAILGNFNSINTWGEVDRYFDNFNGGFTFAHTSSDLTLTFFGTAAQGINDESWRVNDIDVASQSASVVSAPATMVFFLSGLALLAVRRFK